METTVNDKKYEYHLKCSTFNLKYSVQENKGETTNTHNAKVEIYLPRPDIDCNIIVPVWKIIGNTPQTAPSHAEHLPVVPLHLTRNIHHIQPSWIIVTIHKIVNEPFGQNIYQYGCICKTNK